MSGCVCGSGVAYDSCCGPLHDDRAEAPTAVRLMRARYAAFVLADEVYLLKSWHPSTRPTNVSFDADLHWIGLDVLQTEGGGLLDDNGTVEFIARFQRNTQAGALQERSRFVRMNRQWMYIDAAEADLS